MQDRETVTGKNYPDTLCWVLQRTRSGFVTPSDFERGPNIDHFFPDRLNLVICNMSNAKTSFVSFQASHFSIKNRSTNHVCLKPLFGPPFSHSFLMFFKHCRFWDPLRNPMGAKMAPKIDQVAYKCLISSPM